MNSRVSNLFLAIKEDVDRNRTLGRYLLTGSAEIYSSRGLRMHWPEEWKCSLYGLFLLGK